MMQITLYTGGDVSLSPQNAYGRTVSRYVRLIAEEGMGITDGNIITTCVDVLADNVGLWSDCSAPIPEDDEEATTEDYEAALGRFGV